MERQVIATKQAPRAIGPYSQGVKIGGLAFTAGQVGLDPSTGELVAGGVAAETRQVLRNLQAILEASGSSLASVVKTTVFLTNMDDFSIMNQVCGEFFPQDPPARSTVQVSRLPKGAAVEIEAVAAAT